MRRDLWRRLSAWLAGLLAVPCERCGRRGAWGMVLYRGAEQRCCPACADLLGARSIIE